MVCKRTSKNGSPNSSAAAPAKVMPAARCVAPAAIRIEAEIKTTPMTFRRVTKKAPTEIAAKSAQVPAMDQIDSV